jgi:hypothetical protein
VAPSVRTARQEQCIKEVQKEFDKTLLYHDRFAREVDNRYNSYRGLLRDDSEAADWTSRMHPRYIHQVVETITSSLIDPTFKFDVNPRPKNLDPMQHQATINAAKVLERLLAWELDVDKFGIKQRGFVLQGNIAGLTVAKNYWHQKRGDHKKLEMQVVTARDDQGNYLGTYPDLVEVSTEGYLIDGPCFEVVDVRDFFWQEGAISPETSAFFVHRMWKTKGEIEYMVNQGVYGPGVGGQKDISAGLSESNSQDTSDREQHYSNEKRTKDRIEVLEYWTDQKCITLANKTVLLNEKPNPFWHGQKPFVLASPLPDLFRIPGMSVVELIEDLQEMLWTLINQRLDATRLLANPAYAVRSDLDDWGQLEDMYPGKMISVEDVNQIKPFEINPNIPQMTMAAEGMLKADLQNISGGAPFMSGMDSGNQGGIDQKTATGVSIVSNLAQKAMAARKINFVQAYEKMGSQWASMLQQFVREDRAFRVAGKDSQDFIHAATPESIQGQFDVSIKVSNESSVKQERLAEAQAKLQVAVQAAPIFQAVQTPLNLKKFMDDYLDAYDIDDKESYYTALPQQQAPGPGGQQGGPPQPGQPGSQPGVTNAQAAAGPTSPSNTASTSPAVQMQRAGAMNGGAVNG